MDIVLQEGIRSIPEAMGDQLLAILEFLAEVHAKTNLAEKINNALRIANAEKREIRFQVLIKVLTNLEFDGGELQTMQTSLADFKALSVRIPRFAPLAPWLFELAEGIGKSLKWVTKVDRFTKLSGALLVVPLQAAAFKDHGNKILQVLEECLAAQQGKVDPALLSALARVKKGLSNDFLNLIGRMVEEVLGTGLRVGVDVVLDGLQTALADAALGVGLLGQIEASFLLALADLSITVARGQVDAVAKNLEHERLEQSVVLTATLDRLFWPLHIGLSAEPLLSNPAPSNRLLESIGWLVSTRIYMAAFVEQNALGGDSAFLKEVHAALGADFDARKKKREEHAEEIRKVFMGQLPPDAAACNGEPIRLAGGRSFLGGKYVGFNPPDSLAALLGKACLPHSKTPGLAVRLGSPGDLGLVDPAGRRVGTFHAPTGQVERVLEIPGASYTGPEMSPEEIRIERPLLGGWSIELAGTGNGAYVLDVEGMIDGAVVSSSRTDGEFTEGKHEDATFSLQPDAESLAVEVVSPPARRAVVTGRVLNAGTVAPVGGALVKIGDRETWSGEDGVFSFQEVPAGPAFLQASGDGYRPASEALDLPPGALVGQDIALRPIAPPQVELPQLIAARAGRSVTVNAQVLDDGPLTRFEWDWSGDGVFDDLTDSPHSSYVPTEPGVFNLTLRVVDLDGLSATAGTTVVVSSEAGQFRRGDSTGDGVLDLSDAIFTFSSLFTGGPPPACRDAADPNDDGLLDISDGIFTLAFLFLGGAALAPPGPVDCGPDPSGDDLDCASYSCEG